MIKCGKFHLFNLYYLHLCRKDLDNPQVLPPLLHTPETHSDSLIYQKTKNMSAEELQLKPEIAFFFVKAS